MKDTLVFIQVPESFARFQSNLVLLGRFLWTHPISNFT